MNMRPDHPEPALEAGAIPARACRLDYSLYSGQVFRWRPLAPAREAGAGHVGLIGGMPARLTQTRRGVAWRAPASQDAGRTIRAFCGLDVDLDAVFGAFPQHPQLMGAWRRFRGLRILRQPVWECLASFIASSYNTITRIGGLLERTAQAFGTAVAFDGAHVAVWPAAERCAGASESQLRHLGWGFRAPYLLASARRVVEGGVNEAYLRQAPLAEARRAIMALPGVGEKVADCVLLFGCERYDAFPVDVWVERAMRRLVGRRLAPRRLQRYVRRAFGRYAGYAQQYLYHAERLGGRQPARTRTAVTA